MSSSSGVIDTPGMPQVLPCPPRLEWDEDERRRLRRENEEGFLLVPQGARVGVHLNLWKHPFFNVKRPPPAGLRGDFPMETLGHLRALVLSDVTFYVGASGSRSTAAQGGRKTPYAGPVGDLTAADLPDGAGFGDVPLHGDELITFNPRTFPDLRSLFFCVRGNVPLLGASKVVMRDWRLWVTDPILMPWDHVNLVLRQIGLARDGFSRVRPLSERA